MSLKPKYIDFDQTWNGFQPTIEDVITLKSVTHDKWCSTFSTVYDICVAFPDPLADRLYNETKKFLEHHVASLLHQLSPSKDEMNNPDEYEGNENLLSDYYRTWIKYQQGVLYLNTLYGYLNQQHIRKQRNADTEIIFSTAVFDTQDQMEIGELGLDIWKRYMIENLGAVLVRQILRGIQKDRESKNFNITAESTLHGVIDSFVAIMDYKKKHAFQLYECLFESELIRTSGIYYKEEACKLYSKCTVSQYMEEVLKILDEENKRAGKYLHSISIPKLRRECEERMVTDHLTFIYSEVKEMVAQERRHDLENMYALLKPIPDGLNELVQTFLNHIKNNGIETISTLNQENLHTQFVENMLEVHGKYEKLISEIFKNDPKFLSALDKACAAVINSRFNEKQPCRSAELLAKYCDSLLKKSKSTETEIDRKLSNSITIFKYIEDKDVYQKFYSRMLAKRLIHEQSQSMDMEESMINKLKQACGYEYTNKLHRMFTDVSLSTDLNNKFNTHLKSRNCELGINVSVKVLQAGAWPLGPSPANTFVVPHEFERSMKMFEEFYHSNFSGRKLTWLHQLCQGELKASHLKKTYLITMQTFQMAMLLLFEATDSLNCKEIQDNLTLGKETFSKNLQGLLESKVLLSSNEDLEDDTVISLNMDYSNKRTKFKISTVFQKDAPQEVEHTLNAVDDDRKFYLQATIVRILKARKILGHNELIQEILSQSSMTFQPSIPMIKKCIESLIDKQYIERAPNSADAYSYVA